MRLVCVVFFVFVSGCVCVCVCEAECILFAKKIQKWDCVLCLVFLSLHGHVDRAADDGCVRISPEEQAWLLLT